MASKSFEDLDKRFRPLAITLVDQCKAAGVPVTVIDTLRSMQEQADAVKHGNSWTMRSKHLPQPPDGKSLAIDVCPTALLKTKNWSPMHPSWWVVAKIGVALGLRCGMDWHDKGLPPIGTTRASWDPGHFEFVVK